MVLIFAIAVFTVFLAAFIANTPWEFMRSADISLELQLSLVHSKEGTLAWLCQVYFQRVQCSRSSIVALSQAFKVKTGKTGEEATSTVASFPGFTLLIRPISSTSAMPGNEHTLLVDYTPVFQVFTLNFEYKATI